MMKPAAKLPRLGRSLSITAESPENQLPPQTRLRVLFKNNRHICKSMLYSQI